MSRNTIVAMEEYIVEHKITELCDFSAAIRDKYPVWYKVLTTQMPEYFDAFICSFRRKIQNSRLVEKLEEE